MKTDKFNNMIEVFACDFDLAIQNVHPLTKLQKEIENGNEFLLKDIDLLCELDYMLRHGKAEIHIVE